VARLFILSLAVLEVQFGSSFKEKFIVVGSLAMAFIEFKTKQGGSDHIVSYRHC